MSNTEPTEQVEAMDITTAQRVEQERLTRRAVLRKLGFGAGLAAFSMMGVDDFARMVGKRMERMAGDNKVAGQVAHELQSAGIAMASPSSTNNDPNCQAAVQRKADAFTNSRILMGKCVDGCHQSPSFIPPPNYDPCGCGQANIDRCAAATAQMAKDCATYHCAC